MMQVRTADPPASVDEFDAIFAAAEPILIRGVVDRWPAHQRWTLPYLREKLGHRRFIAAETMTGEHRIHVSQQRRIGGHRFFDAYESDDRQEQQRFHLAQVRLLDEAPALLADIGWPRFVRLGKIWQICLWMANVGTRTALHWDGLPAVLSLVRGQKDFWLFAPEDFASLYPNELSDFPAINRSQVDVFEPDLERFPRFRDVVPRHVRLVAGDMLFVPPYWWHYVRNLAVSIAVRWEFDGRESGVPFYNERRRLVASADRNWNKPWLKMGRYV
jgi:[protein]-arginine 3-hydroxylase / protease